MTLLSRSVVHPDDAGHRGSIRTGPARSARQRRGNSVAALLFLLPLLVIFGVFSWGPIVRGVMLAFQRYRVGEPASWVGLENFDYVLSSPGLWNAVGNTLWYTLLALVLGMPVPLIVAILVSEARRYRALFMVIAYIPVILPSVVAALLWKQLYDPAPTGTLNYLLRFVGIGPFEWLNSSSGAMPSIVLEATWASFGSATVIYIAALIGVRSDLYESAELDGAGVFSRIWHVTLPQIRPVLLVMILLQLIGTMQVFTEPFLMTGGGPGDSTVTVLMLVYNYAFLSDDLSAAAALSVLLVVLLIAVAGLFTVLTRRWRDS